MCALCFFFPPSSFLSDESGIINPRFSGQSALWPRSLFSVLFIKSAGSRRECRTCFLPALALHSGRSHSQLIGGQMATLQWKRYNRENYTQQPCFLVLTHSHPPTVTLCSNREHSDGLIHLFKCARASAIIATFLSKCYCSIQPIDHHPSWISTFFLFNSAIKLTWYWAKMRPGTFPPFALLVQVVLRLGELHIRVHALAVGKLATIADSFPSGWKRPEAPCQTNPNSPFIWRNEERKFSFDIMRTHSPYAISSRRSLRTLDKILYDHRNLIGHKTFHLFLFLSSFFFLQMHVEVI